MWITCFPAILERKGVAEMGRKSDKHTRCVTFGKLTGVTISVNHHKPYTVTMPD